MTTEFFKNQRSFLLLVASLLSSSVYSSTGLAAECPTNSPGAPDVPLGVADATTAISPVIGGRFLTGNPILASKLEDFNRLLVFAEKNPILFHFGSALRFSAAGCPGQIKQSSDNVAYNIIPASEASDASKYAPEVLSKFLKNYPPLVVDELYQDHSKYNDYGSVHFFGGPGPGNPERTPWSINVSVASSGTPVHSSRGDFFAPFGVTLVHELRHVEQTSPGQDSEGFSQLSETQLEKLMNTKLWNNSTIAKNHKAADVSTAYYQLMNEMVPTLAELIDLDDLYKKIHSIPIDEEAHYSVTMPSEKGTGLPLGILANKFRQLSEQYGDLQKALVSPESTQFLSDYFKQTTCPSPADYLK
jgi:hypothetical protein